MKFKAWVIETWLAREMASEDYRHAFGYNAEEQKCIAKSERAIADREPVRVAFGFNADEGRRIAKAQKYDTSFRRGWYPLAHEWGWDRDDCARYLKAVTGEDWPKSCCLYCPFSALKANGLARMRRFPQQVAEALALEHQSLALNPRGTLYRDKTLLSIITDDQQTAALTIFKQQLEAAKYTLYRVRRIYKAPGQADRAVEKLATGTRAEMGARFEQTAGVSTVQVIHDISYSYVRERAPDHYPAVEEFFVIAPAVVEAKTRHGFEWFEARWKEALGEREQGRLFE